MGGQDVETASLDHPSEELAVKGLREMGGRCPGMRGQGECCKTWACSSTERKMVLPGEARGREQRQETDTVCGSAVPSGQCRSQGTGAGHRQCVRTLPACR